MATTLKTGDTVVALIPGEGFADYTIECHYDGPHYVAYPATQDPDEGNSTGLVRVTGDLSEAGLPMTVLVG